MGNEYKGCLAFKLVSRMGSVITVNIDNLVECEYNVRRELGDITPLINSIREVGLLQPLVVRPSKRHPGKYEVVVGRRRYHALRALGWREVPVIVREMSDREALLLSLAENVQRGSLTREEEGRAILRLRREFGMSEAEISRALGVSADYVARLMRLVTVAREVGVELVKKAGRWREKVEPEVEPGRGAPARPEVASKVPESILSASIAIARSITSRVPELRGREEELEVVIAEECRDLKQKQIQELGRIVRREKISEIRARVSEEPLEDVVRSVIRDAKRMVLERVSIKVEVSTPVLERFKEAIRGRGLSLDRAVEMALRFAVDKGSEFIDYCSK